MAAASYRWGEDQVNRSVGLRPTRGGEPVHRVDQVVDMLGLRRVDGEVGDHVSP
jgi:hypothetical protein